MALSKASVSRCCIIGIDPDKIEAVKNWPIPKKAKVLHSFLGLSAYYRKFIKNFAAIAQPLYQLINVLDKNFLWTEEHETAFNTLKKHLISDNILSYPDYTAPVGKFVLDTDASDKAIGATLSQYNKEGILKPIAYGSKALTKSQRKYGTTQKELFSLVFFIEYWRHYLIGQAFEVRTDHAALAWLKKSKHTSKLLERWLAIIENSNIDLPTDIMSRMQEHEYTITHREGRQHQNADGLSRRPTREVEVEQIELQQEPTLLEEQTWNEEIHN